MAYLILAQQKISSQYFSVGFFIFCKGIFKFFKLRAVTLILAWLIGAMLIFYGISMYSTFDLGFQIRQNTRELRNVGVKLEEKELEVQAILSSFASEHKIVLESMEKISVMHYIVPPSFVSSQISAQIP